MSCVIPVSQVIEKQARFHRLECYWAQSKTGFATRRDRGTAILVRKERELQDPKTCVGLQQHGNAISNADMRTEEQCAIHFNVNDIMLLHAARFCALELIPGTTAPGACS